MGMKSSDTCELSRRKFLGLAGAGAAGIGMLGLAGCAPSQEADGAKGASGGGEVADYKAPLAPISDEDIAETIEADIVVVGAGCSGSVAAASAAEAGAKVLVLQNIDVPLTHGVAIGAYGSKKAIEAGIDYDILEAMSDANRSISDNRSDMRLNIMWAQNSGELIDWLSGLIDDVEGVGPIKAPGKGIDPSEQDPWLAMYPVAHMIGPGWDFEEYPMLTVAKWLLGYAEENGAEIRYNTPGIQLRQNESGAVTGIVAQRKDGSYMLCNASKAVILSTGDYGNNPEMRKEFLPHMDGMSSGYTRPDANTGDGHLMGLWAGGVMQPAPHAANAHYDSEVDGVPNVEGHAIPWLRVNLLGERFSNEDVAFEQIYAQDMLNLEMTHFDIFDDNYAVDVEKMGTACFRSPSAFPAAVASAVEEGKIYTADTIEGLADAIGVPAEKFKETVDRYTELAKKGIDEDFGKKAVRLTAIEKSPFYAIKRRPAFLTTFGGLKTNTKMQVLNADDQVIKGLYATGNVQGYFFGGPVQPMSFPTWANGRAATTGRVAALTALAE